MVVFAHVNHIFIKYAFQCLIQDVHSYGKKSRKIFGLDTVNDTFVLELTEKLMNILQNNESIDVSNVPESKS